MVLQLLEVRRQRGTGQCTHWTPRTQMVWWQRVVWGLFDWGFMTVTHIYKEKESPAFNAIFPAGVSLVTLTAHFMTSAVSSDTTRSTHLRLGSLSLRICFLTIASKARSGVKSPVLRGRWVRVNLVETEKGRKWRKRKIGDRKEEKRK